MTAQRLHQMQLIYSQIGDRLMLRINTQDKQEFRFWLTRRFIKRIWPGLAQALARNVQPGASYSPQARSAMLEHRHQQAIAQADFNTSFDNEVETIPLGPEPILVTKARLTPMKTGVVILALFPETGQGMELALDSNLLHALCQLFQDALPKTDWDLKLQLGPSTTDHPSMATLNGNPSWKLN
ncbi:MAG: hypothetical protein HQL07_12920 [Nitrospirae bacterium]|nr:hypothetical protein [Magnetococcales bacterium]